MPAKRKQPAASGAEAPQKRAASTRGPSAKANRAANATAPQPVAPNSRASSTRRASSRLESSTAEGEGVGGCPGVIDGTAALCPSPDAAEWFAPPNGDREGRSKQAQAATEVSGAPSGRKKKKNTMAEQKTSPQEPQAAVKDEEVVDPEVAEEEAVPLEELKEALGRPPPVNSGYLPLPWKGRLGFACLNTYLRTSTPPVFSSRTCRIASILEHRHPLADPSQPEHPTKNRPDRNKPASIERGQKYVEALGLLNARDIIKMVRWNDRYNIRFMRLSSEMFPFASHEEYGYKLAPFASEVLAEVGRVIAELGHRVTTHPGQFTQLGSPRKVVVDAAIRDLDYHHEMLSLLKLPEQQDKDAVMILHMGGVFGDKEATLDRFRENYARLSDGAKNRLVLENDDVSWTVHDLLPICKELNIPFVLDYHHHNIMFDETQIREGTLDIMNLYDEIAETWKRKGITQKMHYSEPTPPAITPRHRRKHSARVMTLPPCDPSMDLMIEAKDKEQAVLELMRTFKLPGFDTFTDVIPHQRCDESRAARPPKRKTKKALRQEEENGVEPDAGTLAVVVADEDRGMGGPEGRVYWPPGMEEWLRPPKKVIKKNGQGGTPAKRAAGKRGKANRDDALGEDGLPPDVDETPTRKAPPKRAPRGKAKIAEAASEPSTSEDEGLTDVPSDFSAEEVKPVSKRAKKANGELPPALSRRSSGRVSRTKE